MSYAANPRVTESAPTKNENPGTVTSDSLAGESVQSGGSFAANSDARGVMDQPSSSTNTNNTDISGATTLNAAPNADARDAKEAWSESSKINAGEGLSSSSGSGESRSGGSSTFTTSGGSSGFPSSGGDENSNPSSGSGSGGRSGNGSGSTGGAAQPKGDNLQEGGFSSEDPNSSFDTDIGGKNDPGRAALGTMEASNVPFAGGAGPRQGEVTQDGQFDALGETSA
ncbi:hypothetical protein LTR08_002131 [Meristemomyces frigidus]|nr:hypothetical protein LTR08_002131 [Meristemomyces frigidus]